MTALLFTLAGTVVMCYVRYLYKQESKLLKWKEIDGEWIGYEDFYYCSASDIIVLVNQLGVREELCIENI